MNEYAASVQQLQQLGLENYRLFQFRSYLLEFSASNQWRGWWSFWRRRILQ